MMDVKLQTLTPLWTGGVEAGKVDRIHETGIVGSLRWWYEVLVRGLDGDVCDPTSDDQRNRCQFDNEAYDKALQDGQDKNQALQAGLSDVCTVCRLFGCTGWRRRFGLSIDVAPDGLTPFWLATLDGRGTFNHWWLSKVFQARSSKICFGDLSLQAHFARGYQDQEQILKALLSLMARYGAIGARTQYGFGQFAYPEAWSDEQSIRIVHSQITKPCNPKNLSGDFYSLSRFWHVQCQIDDADNQIQRFKTAYVVGNKHSFRHYENRCLPVSFDIRYKLPGARGQGLRESFKSAHGKDEARRIFGTVRGEDEKRGSRIFVSHLYREDDMDSHYQLCVWGYTDLAISHEIQSALRRIFRTIRFKVTVGQAILDMTKEVP